MKRATDVFVIGGGPAGLAAAIAARHRGFNVTVADGGSPPIDKACGEGLMPDAISCLKDLGVQLGPAQGFMFRGIRFVGERNRVDASFPVGHGLGLRRPALHQRMIEQAERVGVNLLWQSPVNGLGPDGVLVGGKTIGAHWIVGADGIHSRVRRWCRLDAHPSRRRRYAFRRHYHLEPWSDCMEVYWGRRSQAYVTPVGRQDVCVVLVSSIPAVRSSYIAEEFPELAVRLASAERSKERGEVTLTHSLKRVYRGRVALVGDASGSVDAITGEGLSLSFRQAEALALSLQSGNLQAYQTAHRRLARRPAAMGRLLLMLDRHPRLRERALRTLAAHPEVFARTLAVHVGATSVSHLATTGALMGWHFVTA